METALVLRIPEAEAAVAGWRLKHDASAALGMPAHMTVLFPFMPFADIGSEIAAKLENVISSHPAFDLVFQEVKRFPNTNTLWLAPEPPMPIAALTETLQLAFPDYPLYGGAFPEIIPHLTVAQAGKQTLDVIEASLRKALKQPLHAHVGKVDLFVHDAGRWNARCEFALKAAK